MISEAILIPKIYARLQEIASNFSKFFGEAPRLLPTLGSGLGPLTAPLSKILGCAPDIDTIPIISMLVICRRYFDISRSSDVMLL